MYSGQNPSNAPPPFPGRYPQQPNAQQPYAQQPYAQQPYAKQPYGPQPYGPYQPQQPYSQPYGQQFSVDRDPESGSSWGDVFSDKLVRMAFIRKVYSILAVQIFVTVLIISLFIFHEGTRNYVKKRPMLFWVAVGVTFVVMLVLSCCGNVRRSFPTNFICLAIFTLAEGFVLGVSTIKFDRMEIFYAAAITFLVTVALTIFAFQTKIDFTVYGGILFVAAIILFVFGIVCIFFPSKTMKLVYSSVAAFLFCIYLIYDTQMMVGGNHKHSISPEEYIFAALCLYLDIVIIFINILQLIGLIGDDD